MRKIKKTRAIWGMKPGSTILIEAKFTGKFRKVCERLEKKKPYVFTIEKVDDETCKVVCHDDFDAPEKPHMTKRRHSLHFMGVGEVRDVPHDNEASWRSTANYIERNSEKCFLFSRKGYDLKVERLPDGADKSLYKHPKSKYNFEKIEPDESRFYPDTLNLKHVLNAMRAYEKKTGFGFDAEWVEGGLNITRLW